MALENKLGLISSADLAREEERLSKKKAVELFEKILIALLHFREIGHRTVIEIRREHGSYGVHLNRHALRSEDIFQFTGEGGNGSFQLIVILMLQNTQSGDARSHGQRVA